MAGTTERGTVKKKRGKSDLLAEAQNDLVGFGDGGLDVGG